MREARATGQKAQFATHPDATPLRTTRWRLVAITVSLLTVLMLTLGSVVYLATERALMDSLKGTLRGAANAPGLLHRLDNSPLDSKGNGVFMAFARTDLSIVRANGPAGQALPDPNAAQSALDGEEETPYSSNQVDTNGPYLVYTVLMVDFNNNVIGVAQVYISEQQYQQDLRTLLQVLALVSGAGLLASAAISYFLASKALQPVRAAMQRQRDFVADAAHELRTPLAIMRTAAELSLNGGTEIEQQAALEQTLAQNAHLTSLVDSLSLLARADSGTLTLERQPVDLAQLTRDTAGGIAILAEERNVRLQIDAAQELRVLGDSGRLRQLLLIVLDNALKYTPDGGEIAVRAERLGGKAQLIVSDTGPGIDAADLPHLFDRFYRADRARSSDGMGLGLSIAHWIVDAHGGRIIAANGMLGGAVFTITLPPA